ncbi:hypothetical protein IFM89_038440 [Coptis chinensis]|uniref:Uncharacterized protein n=1 Tax=Coptis chinensis TaxID=261450 RepID=A0A835I8M6_9MAGN|nr:hypothetical protein IFM89_038440 [Coptis chinensis]
MDDDNDPTELGYESDSNNMGPPPSTDNSHNTKAKRARSGVWEHFTKMEVKNKLGVMELKAVCCHCQKPLANSASNGTTALRRHVERRLQNIAPNANQTNLSRSSTVGSVSTGRISDWIGHRYTIVLASAIFLLGSVLMGYAHTYAVLMAGRCIAGVGVGFSLMIAPVYSAEISSPSSRGFLTSLPELCISFGILLGYISNYLFGKLSLKLGWRLMLGIATVPSLALALGVHRMPESPKWLVMQGRLRDANDVLLRISNTKEESADRLNEVKIAAGIPIGCSDDIIKVSKRSRGEGATFRYSMFNISDVMDKTWRTLNRASDEYEDAVDEFIEFALAPLMDKTSIRCKPLLKGTIITLTRDMVEAAHRCILFNFEEVQPYIERHKKMLIRKEPRLGRNEGALGAKHAETFNEWFKLEVKKQHLEAVIRARIPNITSSINKTIDELESRWTTLACLLLFDAGYEQCDKVEKVIVSTVLWILPLCLVVVSMGGMTNMERIMKARALRDSSMAGYMSSKKTMEINPKNSIMEESRKRVDVIRMTSRVKDLVTFV